jgi:hypothetical protein
LQQNNFNIFLVCKRFCCEEFRDLTCEPVALIRRVGAAPLVLYGDAEVFPVEERVPDSEVEFNLKFLCDKR